MPRSKLRIPLEPGLVIYRRVRSWWVTCKNLKPRRQSLGTIEQGEAELRARELAGDDLPIDRTTSISLAGALQRFMVEHSKLHHLPNTGKRYRYVIGLFNRRFGRHRRPCEVMRKDVIEFQLHRAKDHARDTVNGDLGYLKSYLNWCRAEGLLSHDPTFKVRKLKVNRALMKTISLQDFDRILDAVKESPFLRDYVIVAANSGMRPNEILHVRGCDLDIKAGMLRITGHDGWQTKTFQDRSLKLSPPVLSVLGRRKIALSDQTWPLFPSRAGTVRDWKNVYHEFKKLVPRGIDCSLYDFRHFFASEAVRRKWDIYDLRVYLGHSCVSTTAAWYVHIRAEQVGAPPVIADGLPHKEVTG